MDIINRRSEFMINFCSFLCGLDTQRELCKRNSLQYGFTFPKIPQMESRRAGINFPLYIMERRKSVILF